MVVKVKVTAKLHVVLVSEMLKVWVKTMGTVWPAPTSTEPDIRGPNGQTVSHCPTISTLTRMSYVLGLRTLTVKVCVRPPGFDAKRLRLNWTESMNGAGFTLIVWDDALVLPNLSLTVRVTV